MFHVASTFIQSPGMQNSRDPCLADWNNVHWFQHVPTISWWEFQPTLPLAFPSTAPALWAEAFEPSERSARHCSRSRDITSATLSSLNSFVVSFASISATAVVRSPHTLEIISRVDDESRSDSRWCLTQFLNIPCAERNRSCWRAQVITCAPRAMASENLLLHVRREPRSIAFTFVELKLVTFEILVDF